MTDPVSTTLPGVVEESISSSDPSLPERRRSLFKVLTDCNRSALTTL